jgi:phosphatidate cytidylyltransferase
LKSDDPSFLDEPTGQVPVVSSADSRVTITGADVASDLAEEEGQVDPATGLPHWTEMPTGQVPIVVAREIADADDPWATIPAPAWREGEADWVAHEEQFDASVLAAPVSDEDDVRPWEFVEPEVEVTPEEILDETPRPEPVRAHRTRRVSDPLAGRAVRRASTSSVSKATVTGVVMALVVFAFFHFGTLPVAALILLVLALAAGEAYAAFRSVGAHPATLLGIVATVTLGFATYNKGLVATGAISVLLLILGFIWYARAKEKVDALDGLGGTFLVFAWVGILGSYALLLISPRSFADKHGLAYLLGAIILTICNDTGALFIGRWLGRMPLVPTLSPNKTREGTAGGTFITLIAGVIVLPLMSPWTATHGILAALAISIVVPLGDLFESMVKRTLGVKDMGHVLPGMGGLLDRVDGLLFALPTMYYLTHVCHFS